MDAPLDDPTPLASLVPPPPLYEATRSSARVFATRLIVPLSLVVLWSVGSWIGALPETVLASPLSVLRAARQMTVSGVLWHHLSVSIARAAVGLLIGGGVGVSLGVIAGLSSLGEDLLDPTVQMAKAVPFLALVPLFIVWFGIGEVSKVLLIAAAAAKPMYLNAFGGVRSVDRKLVEMARVFGLSPRRLVTQIYLPTAMPSMMVGLRLGMSMSLIALIAVEVINTSRGIGFLMLQAQEFFKTAILVVCIVLYALFGLGSDLFVRGLERALMPWRRSIPPR
jgi:sulfonate transport system permease protein